MVSWEKEIDLDNIFETHDGEYPVLYYVTNLFLN